MSIRKIVQINNELCNGCGQCIPNCVEGALQIVNGKARVVKDMYCDGLGACIGYCPQGAISIIEREATPFNQDAVLEHLSKTETTPKSTTTDKKPVTKQWPIQLNLVPVKALFYDMAELLVIADCVPIAYPNLHGTLLPGKAIVIGCPKFDDVQAYAQKLAEILKRNNVKGITIAHMDVPCCSGLKRLVDQAVIAAGKQIPIHRHIITVEGAMK